LLCGLTSDPLSSQRGFRSFASVNLVIDRFAGGAHRLGGLAKYSGDLEVALGPLFELCAGTRRLVGDLLELGDSLLGSR
jgi:hypothetical protein